jgi:quercetin dioxygenase-like cupin family protein
VRDRLRLSLRFDADAMRGELATLTAAAWVDHFVKQNYDGSWSVLPLRATVGARHPIETIYSDPSARAFADTPLLGRCPYFQRVLASFDCPLHAVRLMKLEPGSVIKPHRDHDLAAEYGKARLHIPVVTNPEVEFWLNGDRVEMREGECWYLDLSGVHSVANRSRTDRVHLVIDAVMNAWLEEELMSAERARPVASTTAVPRVRPACDLPVRSDLDRFREVVRRDVLLQQRLRAVEDRDAFIALVVQLASRAGYRTTADEIDGAMRETRRRVRDPR